MKIVDIKFDGTQGEAEVDLSSGVIVITLNDSNPAFPTGLKINVPLDPLFAKLEALSPNIVLKWGEEGANAVVDAIP